MAKEPAKQQTQKKSVKKESAEEAVKKSPKKAEEKSVKSSKPEKVSKDSAVSKKKESSSAGLKHTDVKEPKKTTSARNDYKAKKLTSGKENKASSSNKDNEAKYKGKDPKANSDENETQYTPYKTKAKLSLKGFLISFLVIALFLTLNQFIFHIPGIPTWESVFSDKSPSFAMPDGEIQVHFIDVGQGDSALIVTDEKIVLIDGGEKEYANTVIEYIERLGISKLDLIIASHPHSDHIGSLSDVVDKFEVEELILPKMTKDMIPDTVCYTELIRSADDKKVKTRFVRGGEEIDLTESCVIETLAPVSDYDDLNNYSIVCKLIHGENTFLFTGDIETSAEYDIVESGADLSVDVLKVAHHGSGTSSSYKFLKAVRPTYAVFSVGSPNDYGHPNKTVYDRYKEFECKRYRTDINGDIVFKSDGTSLGIETENNNGHV